MEPQRHGWRSKVRSRAPARYACLSRHLHLLGLHSLTYYANLGLVPLLNGLYMESEMKIAVLIDAENISSKYASIILQEASSLGNLIYKRIYGNWTTTALNSWKKELLDNAIQPIQQYSNTVGKNSSDSALIIDAMDLLYQKHLDAFCIVSSDSDFTRLASRLRESEMFVLGMGEQKTPRAFISACNKFVYLDLLHKANADAANGKKAKGRSKKKPADQSNSTKALSADTTATKANSKRAVPTHASEEKLHQRPAHIEQKHNAKQEHDAHEPEAADDDFNGLDIITVENALREIAEEFSGDDGWILSSSLGARLARRLPDFDTRNFGFKKFVPFIESLGFFESKSVKESENSGVKTIYFRLIEE